MATSAEINRLMDAARIRLPGALDGVIQLEFFSVMNEFFQGSNCWTEDIDVTLKPGVSRYDVVPSVGTPNRLMHVRDKDMRAIAASMPTPGLIELRDAVPQELACTVQLALTVDDPVTRDGFPQFPEWVLNKYNNDILDGVLGRMMSQVAKPYSSERMAIYHLRRFRAAVALAKVEAMQQNLYRGQAWKFPQSFAARRIR